MKEGDLPAGVGWVGHTDFDRHTEARTHKRPTVRVIERVRGAGWDWKAR